MISLTWYRLTQIISGFFMGSSLIFMGIRAYGNGQVLTAGAFLIIGSFGFVFPGLLMNRVRDWGIEMKNRIITGVKSIISDKLPSIPLF